MLFPNHPDYAIIGPHMGYAPGARTFGYAAGSNPLGYAPGARSFMGEISQAMMDNGHSGGIAVEDLNLLSSVGATDDDVQDLLNGNTTLADLYTKYGVTIHPAGSTPSGSSSGSSSQAGRGEVPAGSRLLYTATWTAGLGNVFDSPNEVISKFSSLASARSLQITSGKATDDGPVHYGIQVSLIDTIGNQYKSDAQGVLDELLKQVIGHSNFSGSELAITAIPSAPGQVATDQQPQNDPMQWLQDNILYVGIGIGGLVLLNNMTGKRR